ncbi:MAG: GDP-L-fucose synthase [Alphaproteobacteria bacterium]|nr:MAG: GDP-L-fucose synthase [Alphaproteobacteria bacterium]
MAESAQAIPFSLAGKRIFVAGHRGMVGSATVRRLAGEGGEIITAPRDELDLRDQTAVSDWMDEARPAVVFLAAAKVGGILANDSWPADFLYDNLMIEANVIHAAFRSGVEKLLFLGSSCIYPKFARQPIPESELLAGPLEPTNEWYAIAKIAGIKLCQAYRRQHGADFISAMPCNLYGPGDNFDLQSSHVLPALIRKFHLARLAREGDLDGILADEACHGRIPDDLLCDLGLERRDGGLARTSGDTVVRIWGTGRPRREFLHVDDLADALIFLMENYSDAEHVNVGAGTDISIRELAELVREVVGFEGRLEFDTSKPDGTPRKLLDITKISELGWQPRIALKDGIAEVHGWYVRRLADAQTNRR